MAERKQASTKSGWLLTGSGGMLLPGGLVWDAKFASVPYRDATPALAAQFAFHAAISSWTMVAGALIMLARRLPGFTRFLQAWIGRRTWKSS